MDPRFKNYLPGLTRKLLNGAAVDGIAICFRELEEEHERDPLFANRRYTLKGCDWEFEFVSVRIPSLIITMHQHAFRGSDEGFERDMIFAKLTLG